MKTAFITGGIGDIVYALKICKALQVRTLFVRRVALENGSDTFKAVENLIHAQGITPVPIDSTLPLFEVPKDIPFDYNFDTFREQPNRGRNHILLSMARQFQVKYDIAKPWLHNIEAQKGIKDIVFVTQRWRTDSKLKWNFVLQRYNVSGIFVGFKSDYENFMNEAGEAESRLSYYPTEDLLHVAEVIKGSRRLFCNQNPALAIAQGLGGVQYYCEFKPGKTNTRLFIQNENYLK